MTWCLRGVNVALKVFKKTVRPTCQCLVKKKVAVGPTSSTLFISPFLLFFSLILSTHYRRTHNRVEKPQANNAATTIVMSIHLCAHAFARTNCAASSPPPRPSPHHPRPTPSTPSSMLGPDRPATVLLGLSSSISRLAFSCRGRSRGSCLRGCPLCRRRSRTLPLRRRQSCRRSV